MTHSKHLVLFTALAIVLGACADKNSAPPMGKSGTYVITPSGPNKPANLPTLIVTTPVSAKNVPVVKTGSVNKYVLPLTLCAHGGSLSLNFLRLMITSADGALLLNNASVFTDIAIGKNTGTLLGPANYDTTDMDTDDATEYPMMETTLYGSNGPLVFTNGQCEDLWVSFTTIDTANAAVVGHEYTVEIETGCVGPAVIAFDGNKPFTFKMAR
jgi:hypothetical protein